MPGWRGQLSARLFTVLIRTVAGCSAEASADTASSRLSRSGGAPLGVRSAEFLLSSDQTERVSPLARVLLHTAATATATAIPTGRPRIAPAVGSRPPVRRRPHRSVEGPRNATSGRLAGSATRAAGRRPPRCVRLGTSRLVARCRPPDWWTAEHDGAAKGRAVRTPADRPTPGRRSAGCAGWWYPARRCPFECSRATYWLSIYAT